LQADIKLNDSGFSAQDTLLWQYEDCPVDIALGELIVFEMLLIVVYVVSSFFLQFLSVSLSYLYLRPFSFNTIFILTFW